MRLRTSTVLFALAPLYVSAMQIKKPNEDREALKQKLFARYDQQNVVVIPTRVLLGPLSAGRGLEYGDHYSTRASHFDKSTQIPNAYKKLSSLDENTFISANEQRPGFTMSTGSQDFVVVKFYVKDREVILALQSRSPGDTNGVDFHFVFPPDLLRSGDYESIVKEINHYVVPEREAREQTENAKKIEIQPGMLKEDVIKTLGEPLKTVVFGKKTVLRYADVTVELVDDRVTDVKAN